MQPADFDLPSELTECTIQLPFDVQEIGMRRGEWIHITPRHPKARAWKIQPITQFYAQPGGRFRSLLELVLALAGLSRTWPSTRSRASSAVRNRLLRLLS